MLGALLSSRGLCASAEALQDGMGIEDATFPKQVVQDAASKLRDALRKAVESAGLVCENPLPSMGKGRDLAYHLRLP
jgi:hypothetical protein